MPETDSKVQEESNLRTGMEFSQKQRRLEFGQVLGDLLIVTIVNKGGWLGLCAVLIGVNRSYIYREVGKF